MRNIKTRVYVFIILVTSMVGCSPTDYEISNAYEVANITAVTIYKPDSNPQNIVELFDIDVDKSIVKAFVPEGADLTRLRLVLTISTGASVSPAVSGFMDLSLPKEYIVTSPNQIINKKWTIVVSITPKNEY